MTQNRFRPTAMILPGRGNPVSLSPGERVGVRADSLHTDPAFGTQRQNCQLAGAPLKQPFRILRAAAIACCLLAPSALKAQPADATIPAPLSYHADWRWVKGAVFVPTKYVNEAQQWDEYDPVINDRELHYASIYGLNCVRVYLHFDIYLKKKAALLDHIEDFLTRASKYGIKTEFVFFDDCWNQPDPAILSPDY